MTVEVTPVGVQCNLSCPYCYQNPMRDAGNAMPGTRSYDMDAMKQALVEEGSEFTVFGGEALLTDLRDLEELWKFGLDRYGKNGIQTNATLITDEHIPLFIKYRVHVGISMDGPDELNDSRWAGSLEKTREMTRRSQSAIEKLCAAGHPPSLIATLYRGNALPHVRPRLKAWIRRLDELGVSSMRLHLLEIDHPLVRQQMQLTTAENIEALLDFANFELQLERIKFDLFQDVIWLLKGEDNRVTCTWAACDPMTTSAVRGVDGDGNRSNCGRTNKDGVAWVKADTAGYERQLALYHTPQEHGGCEGCRFFVMCKGQCPGTAMGGDWRNRTDECEIWKAIFGHYERFMESVGVQPLSKSPDLKALEMAMLAEWGMGRNTTIVASLHRARHGNAPHPGNSHGDAPHGDSDMPQENRDHGDIPHGDSEHGDAPHSDSHEDSWA